MEERINHIECPIIIVKYGHFIEAIVNNDYNNKNEIIPQIANGSLSVMLNKKFVDINHVLI